MSALPPKADIRQRDWNVHFVPKADIPVCAIKWWRNFIDKVLAQADRNLQNETNFIDVKQWEGRHRLSFYKDPGRLEACI